MYCSVIVACLADNTDLFGAGFTGDQSNTGRELHLKTVSAPLDGAGFLDLCIGIDMFHFSGVIEISYSVISLIYTGNYTYRLNKTSDELLFLQTAAVGYTRNRVYINIDRQNLYTNQRWYYDNSVDREEYSGKVVYKVVKVSLTVNDVSKEGNHITGAFGNETIFYKMYEACDTISKYTHR